MISIAAGTSIGFLARQWGRKARIVRAMPNTPGAIGRGITALYAAPNVTAKDKALAGSLLAALGETVWVKSESLIDAATAVSGSGPAYVFLLAEALAAAGRPPGLAARGGRSACARHDHAAQALCWTPTGVAPAELRRDVTSPGGTTEAALKILMAQDGFVRLDEARRRRRQKARRKNCS